jgi:tetratricopeptide (TPR) repeat protein
MFSYLHDAAECNDRPTGLLAMADYYMWRDRPEDAMRILKTLVDANDAAATARVAAILYDRGDRQGAAQMLDRLLARDPSNVGGLVVRARIALNNGDLEQAHEYSRRAGAIAPDSAAVRTMAAAIR